MKTIYLLPLLVILACSSGETKTNEITVDSTAIPTESIQINDTYYYEITNLKTGEVKELTQQEYLQSDYIENANYSVKEKTRAN